jgi:uncharacterized protein YjbI with pentapeptide repeats
MAFSSQTSQFKRNLSAELTTSKSAGAFNRKRRPPTESHRTIAITGIVLKRRNLRSFDLSFSRFTGCHFENTDFGALEEVEFADCSFKNCSFNSNIKQNDTPALGGVIFYNCDFEGTHFRELNLKNIQFGKCRFETNPQFIGSHLQGLLRIEDSGKWSTYQNLADIDVQLGWDTSFRTDLEITRPLFFSWVTIRSLQQMPFLQVSLFGFVLLTAQVGLVSILFTAVQKPEVLCRSMLQHLGSQDRIDLSDTLSRMCAALDPQSFLHSVNSVVLFSMLLFTALFLGALIHKLRCPTAIAEYSLNDWTIDRKKPILLYEMLSMRNPGSLAITASLYVSALGIFIFGFIAKFIRILAVEF